MKKGVSTCLYRGHDMLGWTWSVSWILHKCTLNLDNPRTQKINLFS